MTTTTRFIHLDYPRSHPGADRIERAVDATRQAAVRLGKGMSAFRGLAGVLLAAMVATLLVVTDQLVDTWADGHLLAAWVLTWMVGFSALALLAPAARGLASRTIQGLNNWSSDLAHRRADERLLALAQKDPRVMADIRAAALREELVLDGGQATLKGTVGYNAGFGGGQGPEMDKNAAKAKAAVLSESNPEAFVAAMSAGRALQPEVVTRLSRLSRRIWND